MRWHLLGRGNMGVLAAFYLERAGIEPVFVHPDGQAVIRRLHLPDSATPRTVHYPCITPAATDRIRGLLLATKGPQTGEALAPLLNRLAPQATLLRLQNGLGTLEGLDLPWHLRRFEAVSFSGSWRQGNDHHVVAENATLMGDGSERPPDWFESLQGHWPHLHWEADIQLHQLMKLAVNAVINPLTAVHDCNNGALAEDPGLAREARELAREVDAILARVRPDWPGHTGDRSLGVARDTAANTSSMRSDYRAGRPTEIDFINGWLLARARETGMPAPLNEHLVQAIRQRQA